MRRSAMTLMTMWGLILVSSGVWAAWPDDATENLLICNHQGEQSVPKIAATSDGGCYIAWHDNGSGNYDIYVQRLNADGIPQFAENGLLVSDHPQETWITDWDMTVDGDNNCIIAINDIRAGGDWDIYAFKVSPTGEQLWSDDGLTISDNGNFEPDPRVVVTSGGNIAFTWSEETDAGVVVNVRKVTPAGADVWNPPLITLTNGINGLSIPRIVACENDGVIVQYLAKQGTEYWRPRHIYMQKYDSLGVAQWAPSGVPVMTTNGIGVQMKPELTPDGSGGALSYWYDSRVSNELHAYAQHVSSNGTVLWTANGVRLSNAAQQFQMSPSLIYLPASQEALVFYEITDPGQNNRGLGGQKVANNGSLLWGNGGIALIPLSDVTGQYSIFAEPLDDGAVVVFKEYVPGSAINTYIKAIRVNNAGVMQWGGEQTLCSVNSEKGHMAAVINTLGQTISTWQDKRAEPSGDMYVQNINPNGTLGDLEPGGPPSIEITSPADSSVIDTRPIVIHYMVDNFVVAPSGGDGMVSISANGISVGLDTTPPDSFRIFGLETGWYTIVFELVDYSEQPLSPRVADSIHIMYVPNPPTIELTSPTESQHIEDLPLTIRYDVENFVVAGHGGDGLVALRINMLPIGDSFNPDSMVYDGSGFIAGWNIVAVELITYEHEPLDPPVADSVWIDFAPDASDDLFTLHPSSFILSCYPNPFNPAATISFTLPSAQPVTLSVYNSAGQLVENLADRMYAAGIHSVSFNGTNLATGVYLCRMETPQFSTVQKIILLK